MLKLSTTRSVYCIRRDSGILKPFCSWVRHNLSDYHVVLALVITAIIFQQFGLGESNHKSEKWIATWTTSATDGGMKAKYIRDQTLREIVHTSIGGDEVRVRISNRFGQQPLLIGGVHVALPSNSSGIIVATDRAVTFSGQQTMSVPPGALVLSDPIPFTVHEGQNLAISIYFPNNTPVRTVHPNAFQNSYLSEEGNYVGTVVMQNATIIKSWPFLTGVDVVTDRNAATIVAFGDSITDGTHSTPNSNHRWPDILAERFSAHKSKAKFGVVNAGISGNRLLFDGGSAGSSALERFSRDVLIQPGVKYVIVLEGINDIGAPGPYRPLSEIVTAADLIVGFRQLIARAHVRDVKIYGCTLTPFEGSGVYYTMANEKKREEVNNWIRTSHAFDGVIDFDQAVRDPDNPKRILPLYDSNDHLHPNDTGYRAMADAIDLRLFQ